MKRVIILTADELRHDYFKIKFALDKNINVIKTFCDITKKKGAPVDKTYSNTANIHFSSRSQTERDFFKEFVTLSKDFSNSQYISPGEINNESFIEQIKQLNPDFIVTYGCCIIKPNLIDLFKNKIINVHLGLSPYYFGSGTNFHPFVNKELSAIGCTFMYMDEGIDTGKIIHQIRATIDPCDHIHHIGNRLIKEMTHKFIDLIKNFEHIQHIPQPMTKAGKTYKRSDCNDHSIHAAYKNISNGVCLKHLKNKEILDLEFPITQQEFLC